MDLGLLTTVLVFGVLLYTRDCTALCAAGTFDSTCICINDASCASSEVLSRLPHCNCDNGIELSLGTAKKDLQKMNQNGTNIDSLYIAGFDINSLDPFLGAFGSCRVTFVIKETSVASLTPLSKVRCMGSLSIISNRKLTNLTGLHRLTHVRGFFNIERNRNLTDISGLSGLVSVGTDFTIVLNDALTDVYGLSNLTSVGKHFSIRYNGALSNVSGLSSLTFVGKHFDILYNHALKDVSGLSSLTSVGKDLIIEDNMAFTGVFGLPSLAFVSRHFIIRQNDALMKVSGLSSLTSVGKNFAIRYNRALTDVAVLPKLTSVGGDLIMEALKKLNDIRGFPYLNYVGRDLRIIFNGNLPDIAGFEKLQSVRGSLLIENNYGLQYISGFANLNYVKGNISIWRNDALENIYAFENLTSIGGSLIMSSNRMLSNIGGFENLRCIDRSLIISFNDRLGNIGGFSKVESFGGDLIIEFNELLEEVYGLQNIKNVNSFTAKNNYIYASISGLANLNEIRGSLLIEDARYYFFDLSSLGKVWGDLLIYRTELGIGYFGGGSPFLENVIEVGGSVRVVDNKFDGHLNMFHKLQSICSKTNNATPCGLTIKGNVGHETLNTFPSLTTINGSLTITDNTNLRTIVGFEQLKSIVPEVLNGGGIEALSSGLVVAFNKNLRSMTFEALEVVKGVVIIFGNAQLNHINMSHLHDVTDLTKIAANGHEIMRFVSNNPLPFDELGCRNRKNMVPYITSSNGELTFVTDLEKRDCVVKKVTPVLVGLGIIVLMIVVSLWLFYNALLQYYSPYRRRVQMQLLVNTFATRLLTLADVFSDVGFTVTVFLLWDSKEGEICTSLLVIGILSIAIVVVASSYMVINSYWGLTSRQIMEEISFATPTKSLLEYLNQEQGMQLKDWFIVLVGLMALDVGVIKCLPWGDLVSGNNDGHGLPHKYFLKVAFVAGLIEDVSQISLQIAFIASIEEDDGWAITGAMAAMTLSIADAMVKFVFPTIVRLFASNRVHLNREHAMPKMPRWISRNSE